MAAAADTGQAMELPKPANEPGSKSRAQCSGDAEDWCLSGQRSRLGEYPVCATWPVVLDEGE